MLSMLLSISGEHGRSASGFRVLATQRPSRPKGCYMVKTNYSFAKRQRDLAKKQQKEAKRQRKAAAKITEPSEEATPQPPRDSVAETQ